MKRIIAGIVVLFASAIAIWVAYGGGIVRFAYPDAQQYPVRGVDVSRHQGVIDWPQLARENVRFAYVKATEGGDLSDPMFDQNVAGARAAGLDVGTYHFFTLCRSGRQQAEFFVARTANQPVTLRPAIDLEFGGNCKTRPGHLSFNKELMDFLTVLRSHGLAQPIFYTTREFHRAYLSDSPLAHRPIWLSDVILGLEPLDGKTPEVWQYAHNARIKGINGPVDMNAVKASAYTAVKQGVMSPQAKKGPVTGAPFQI